MDEVEPGEGDTSVIDLSDTLDEVLIEEMEEEEEAEVPATPQPARATVATPEAPYQRAIKNALDETIDLPLTPHSTRATVANPEAPNQRALENALDETTGREVSNLAILTRVTVGSISDSRVH